MLNYLCVLMLCLIFATSDAVATDELMLSQPDMRITDNVVETDLQFLQSVQKRLDQADISHIKHGGYHKEKAQALLDFTWDEYHENDRTGAVEAAFSYVQQLLAAMEQGKTDISMDTRLLPGTRIVNQADSDALNAMKQDKRFHCAEAPIAASEIALLWVGHEYDELGWRHSRSQQKNADDYARKAKEAMNNCDTPAPQVEPACIPASRICEQAVIAPPPALPVIKTSNIPSHRTIVYFDLDQHALKATGPGTLNAALKFIQQYPDAYRIRIEAHTDRLASTAYNQTLSQQRAKRVRDYLVKHGVDTTITEIAWYGETRPVIFCNDKDYGNHQALADCLQPNRRAEVLLYTPTKNAP